MNILILGVTGDVGSRIAKEALARGHQVTGVIRDPEQVKALPAGITARVGDAADRCQVSELARGQDLVVSAVRPAVGQEQHLTTMTAAILAGAAAAGVRVLIVGGAARLTIPGEKNLTVLTKPGFLPQSVVPIARACFEQYQICRNNLEADWTYLTPPALLRPGVRTGQYRLGRDELVTDGAGNSKISLEDFAVALLDEAEHQCHRRVAFTVGY